MSDLPKTPAYKGAAIDNLPGYSAQGAVPPPPVAACNCDQALQLVQVVAHAQGALAHMRDTLATVKCMPEVRRDPRVNLLRVCFVQHAHVDAPNDCVWEFFAKVVQ